MSRRPGTAERPCWWVTTSSRCRHAWTLVSGPAADMVLCWCAGAAGPAVQPAASAMATAAARSILIGAPYPARVGPDDRHGGVGAGGERPDSVRPAAREGHLLYPRRETRGRRNRPASAAARDTRRTDRHA